MKSRQPLEISKTVPIPLGMTYKMRVRIEGLSYQGVLFLIALSEGGETIQCSFAKEAKT